MSHGHGVGHGEGENKKIAIFISILALMLAIAETAAKSAQTDAVGYNIEASNLWSFFQAKTIRMTMLKTAGEQMSVDMASVQDPAAKDLMAKRIDSWNKAADRYNSEPETGEGRKELSKKAVAAEKKRKDALARYHHFEMGSAAFQIAIVLASAFVITSVIYLLWIAGGLAGIGVLFTLVGFFAPHLFHLF